MRVDASYWKLVFPSALFKFLRSVESDVCLAVVEELLHIVAVDVAALALLIGAVIAAFAHAFIDADAEPAERLVDIFLGSGHEAVGVGVLDAENHVAAVLAGEEVVIEGCTHASDMEGACGRGGKTYSNFSVSHFGRNLKRKAAWRKSGTKLMNISQIT